MARVTWDGEAFDVSLNNEELSLSSRAFAKPGKRLRMRNSASEPDSRQPQQAQRARGYA